jgi:hypothetical protein
MEFLLDVTGFAAPTGGCQWVRYSIARAERKGIQTAICGFSGEKFRACEPTSRMPLPNHKAGLMSGQNRSNIRIITMRTLPLALAFSLLSSFALAADPMDPVTEVMKVTQDNWNTVDSDWKYIFDADPLARLFSKKFQAAYAEAAKHPAYDTENNQPGDPFGYDVITSSQDGCPLQDVTTKAAPGANGMTDVTVTFKQWTCVDDAEVKNTVSEVHFDVIDENGKPVIDDIHRVGDGERDSLLEEMHSIAKGE